MQTFFRRLQRQKGSALLQYAAITGILSVATLGVLHTTGRSMIGLFVQSQNTMTHNNTAVPGAPPTSPTSPNTPSPPTGTVMPFVVEGQTEFLANPSTRVVSHSFSIKNPNQTLQAAPTFSLTGDSAFSLSQNTCSGMIAPQGTCSIKVDYTASDNADQHHATLSAGAAKTALTGSASGFMEQWTSTYNGASMNAGISGARPFGTFVIQNTGSKAAGFTHQTVGENPEQFEVFNLCQGITLEPNDTCNIMVRLKSGTLRGTFRAEILLKGPMAPGTTGVFSAQRT